MSLSEDEVYERNHEERKGLLVRVRRKFKNAFAKSKKFKAPVLRQVILSTILPLTMNEVYVHLLLKRSADAGEVPGYINDVVFTGTAAVEAVLTPILVWVGYRRRMRVAAWWTLLATFAPLPLMFLPNTAINQENADLCNPMQSRLAIATNDIVIARTVMVVLLALITALARAVVWIHGTVFIDDYSPMETGYHFAILLAVRVIFLNFTKYAFQTTLDLNVWLAFLMLAAPVAISALKLFLTPDFYEDEEDLPAKDAGRAFFPSICRTLSNKTAMMHTVALSLLVAGVWGFSLLNYDLMKTKYLVTVEQNGYLQFMHLLPLLVIIYGAVIDGADFSSPKITEFDPKSVVKFGASKTVFIGALILLLTFIKCNGGAMVGLSTENYTQPICSSHCGCSPTWNEFTPVCAVNSMNTFYSPCHAGCTTRDTYNDTSFLTKCSCTGSATNVVIPGPCNGRSCFNAYIVHTFLLAILHGFTVAAILTHFLVVIRAVDERDKTIALSLLFSCTSLVAYVGGHWFYRKLSFMTCAFTQYGRCEFHNSHFPLTLGLSSFGLVLISFIITFASWIIHRHYVTKKGRVSSMVS